jgi:hypothetical protein
LGSRKCFRRACNLSSASDHYDCQRDSRRQLVFDSDGRGLQPMRRLAITFIFTLAVWIPAAKAQTYNTNTTITPVPYQAVIPNMGGINGCNTTVKPLDFNNPITRVTCGTTGTNANDRGAFGINCGGSSEVNFMNKNDDRFFVCSNNNNITFFSWNGTTATQGVSQLGGACCGSDFFWSFTQPYIAYEAQSSGGGHFSIYSWNFTNVSRPTKTALVDLVSACRLPRMTQINDGVGVSADDQTFSVLLSTTAGQDSPGAVWVATWNPTNGCRVWNIQTGAITGNGGTSMGTSTVIPATWAHNVRIAKGGQYLRVGTNALNAEYYWQINSLTVTVDNSTNDPNYSSGHLATGTSHSVQNSGGCGSTLTYHHQGHLIYPAASPLTKTALFACNQAPASYGPLDWHQDWANANASDNNPVFASSFNTTGFAVSHAWENEIVGFATDGSGTVYRFAHTYNTNLENHFMVQIAEMGVSQDGQWVAWASDWNGTLGDQSGATNCKTPPSSCRGDVFLMKLPIVSSGNAPAVSH